MQKELFLCSSSLYLRTAGDDRSNLAFILHMILASGSVNILYIPPPHTINRTKTRFFLNISSSSQVIHSLSEIQQCSGNATGFLLFPLLCFLLLCNNTILVLFYRGKEVDFIHSCLIYSVCVFRKEKLMQVKWNPLEHQIECHLKWALKAIVFTHHDEWYIPEFVLHTAGNAFDLPSDWENHRNLLRKIKA